jgi:hypothetical protein
MDNSSMGLTMSLSPEMAAQLRQQEERIQAQVEAPVEVAATKKNDDDDDMVPLISIDLEQLIGYRPQDSEELDSIKSQLLTAMWTRYKETTTSDGETETHQQLQVPPPDFDTQALELLETGVARVIIVGSTGGSTRTSDDKDDNTMRIRYPPSVQSPTTGERISTARLWQHIVRPPNSELPVCQRLWKFLPTCSLSLFWKRDMASELARLIQEEQVRLDYQQWTESTRQAKLDNLYSIRETIVHQVEVTKAKVDALEEARETQVQEAMQTHHRRREGGLEAFGRMTELSFPEEFQLLGFKKDDAPALNDGDEDWGLMEDDDSSYHSSDEDNEGYSSDDSEGVGGEDHDRGYDCDNDDLEEVRSSATLGDQPPLPLDATITTTTPPATAAATTLPNENVDHQEEGTVSNQALPTTTTTDEATPAAQRILSTPFQSRQKRREKAKRKKRQERKDAERKTQLEQLRAMEEQIRAKYTTKELILAQTILKALEGKIQKVEELLESLQDEVWEAEEDAEKDQGGSTSSTSDESSSFSLLDQVLAMILGATPIQSGLSPQEHFQNMQAEHKAIVQDWKEHFGRLPPPASSGSQTAGNHDGQTAAPINQSTTTTPSEQRMALGITDNDADDWDAVDDWDELIEEKQGPMSPGSASSSATTTTTNISQPGYAKPSNDDAKPVVPVQQPTKPKLVGLRPGGRVKR